MIKDSLVGNIWLYQLDESNARGAADEILPEVIEPYRESFIPFHARPTPIPIPVETIATPRNKATKPPTTKSKLSQPFSLPSPTSSADLESTKSSNSIGLPSVTGKSAMDTTPGGRPKRQSTAKLPILENDDSSELDSDIDSVILSPVMKKTKLEVERVRARSSTPKLNSEEVELEGDRKMKGVKELGTALAKPSAKEDWKTDSEDEEMELAPESDTEESDKFWTLQRTNCQAASLKAAKVSPCYNCRHKTSERIEICVFRNVRSLRTARTNDGGIVSDETRIFETELDDHLPVLFQSFFETFTPEQAQIIQTGIAPYLLPIMKAELAEAIDPNAIRLNLDLSHNSICDGCLTTIMMQAFMCQNCGREFCSQCKEDVHSGNSKKVSKFLDPCGPDFKHSNKLYDSFVPIYRISTLEMSRIIRAVESCVEEENSKDEEARTEIDPELLKSYYEDTSNITRIPEPISRQFLKVPVLDIDDPSRKEATLLFFGKLWSRGEPMLVDVDLGKFSRKEWTPEGFQKEFGDQNCSIESSILGKKARKAKVADYFEDFGKVRNNEEGESLRIKDWPPSQDFKEIFSGHFEDFMDMLPVKPVTRRDGFLNLSSHFPTNTEYCKPDLGPKLYISHTSDDTIGGTGSTKLHMDSADAVNLMAWSALSADGSPGVAAWDLFPAEDSNGLRKFLAKVATEKKNAENLGKAHSKALEDGVPFKQPKNLTTAAWQKKHKDPVHGIDFYLDEAMRKRLLEETGIKSWRILQRMGQMVFIPSGVAHQVCNFSDSIKIACDFISIENIPRMLHLTEEFRSQTNMKDLWKSDIVQLTSLLFWSWLSAERFEKEKIIT